MLCDQSFIFMNVFALQFPTTMVTPKATAGENNVTTDGEAATKNPTSAGQRKVNARSAVGGKAPRKQLGKPVAKATFNEAESESESEEEAVLDVLSDTMTTGCVTSDEEEQKVSTEHVLADNVNG